ncbi:Gly-Xaa carboxypeptidase [Castilleja foliolosa]|uniref:Gly-Xaa carboxypeptidase n=1 Tax=Castilleja foliolosa TaxID=1961234 RepID=A0ABD3DVI2_9LAMI
MASFFSQPATAIHLRSPPPASPHRRSPAAVPLPRPTAGVFPTWKPVLPSSSSLQCNAISRSRTEAEYVDVIQNGLSVLKWNEIVEDDADKDTKERIPERIRELVDSIKSMLQSMGDGEISISPYDTAWVALVEDISGGAARAPQFPASLDWISNSQLDDGSWGDCSIFSIYDRLLNTLGCVVALRSWNMHPDKTHKGIMFIKENIHKLEDENEEHMPIGYEVALPSLIEIAKKLEIDIPENTPGLQEIYARRELKLTRIPRDIMHKMPTTLLHSLEGMGKGLMWEKLLKFQCANGSFLFSPSSTAFALQQTKDLNCLKYLDNCVRKFKGGVPNVYPVDMFEHVWAVDRLQRLGISRHFQPEIDECLDYVHRYWTDKGICWARNSHIVQDIDDTAMGFRLMRLHGYDISADVFKNFEKGGEFFCFAGQSTQAVTGMYNLYRASQLRFPGEHILADAADYSANFLKNKRANNELLDKWIITKDLPGEVGYALDVAWYANLPRVETRFYLEQYGGEDDVWIGKTLYRMPNVSNNTYLELAKLDYNNCQALHQREWKNIQKWYKSSGLEEFGSSERRLLRSYYIASACVFEPEKWEERFAWAKTAILTETIVSYFERQGVSKEQKRAFVNEFEHASILNYAYGGRYKTQCGLLGALITTVNQLSLDILLANGQDIRPHLNHAWHKWLKKCEEGNIREGDVELFVRTLNLCVGGRKKSVLSDKALLSHLEYEHLFKVTTRVCYQLRLFGHQKLNDSNGGIRNVEIESDMQELVKLVVTKSLTDLDTDIKQNFLNIARSFYYVAYFSPETINFHMCKVLFEEVL